MVDEALSRDTAAADLRAIVLAPTRDFLRLGVWLRVEWENYPYAESPEDAAGFVSLSAWLDRVDAVASGALSLPAPTGWAPRRPLRFQRAERDASFSAVWLELHRALVATGITVATTTLATRFKQPVGVFASLSGSECPLVAFCDRHGAPLYPMREHRREHGYSSSYPQAAITKEQFTIFYPEGEGGSDGQGAPSIRRWLPGDVEAASPGERGDREVHIHFKGELATIEFSGGHTREEHGGPDRHAVTEALTEFASAGGRMGLPPSLPAAQDFAAALQAQVDGPGKWLSRLVKAHGFAPVSERVNALSLPAKQLEPLHAVMASEALDSGAWQATLEHQARGAKKNQGGWQAMRAHAALGHWADVLALAKDDDVAEKALAWLGTGEVAKATEALANATDDDEMAVKALLAAKHPLPGVSATDLVRRALAGGVRDHILVHLALEPQLKAVLDEAARVKVGYDTTRLAAEAVAASVIDRATSVTLDAGGPSALLAAPLSDTKPAKAQAFTAPWAHRGSLFAFDSTAHQLVELRAGQAAKAVATLGCDQVKAVVPVNDGHLVAHDSVVEWFDENAVSRAQLTVGPGSVEHLAVRGNDFAVSHREHVTLGRLDGGRLVATGAWCMPQEAYVGGLGYFGPGRLLASSTGGEQTVLIDVSQPAAPRFLARFDEGFEVLSCADGSALVNRDGQVHQLRVSDLGLSSQWSLKAPHSVTLGFSDDGRIALVGRGEVLLVQPGPLRVERRLFCGPDGYPFEPEFAQVSESRVVALVKHGLVELTPTPLARPEIEQFVEQSLPTVRDGVKAKVAAWVKDGVSVGAKHDDDGDATGGPPQPFAGLTAMWRGGVLRLMPQVAKSVVGLNHGFATALELPSSELEEPPAHDEAKPKSEAKLRFEQSLLSARLDVANAARDRALSQVLREVVTSVAPQTRAQFVVAGLLGREFEIVDVVPGGGDVKPQRATSVARAEQTLYEQFNSPRWYMSVDAWVLRARRDAAFRAEVFELVSKHDVLAAVRVAEKLVDVDPEAFTAAFLAAGERNSEFAFSGLAVLAERGHPVAKQKLTAMAETDNPDLALPARRVLGRIDEDATVDLVKKRLEGIDDEYNDEQVPVRTLAGLSDERLVRLKDVMLATKAKLVRGEALLVPLVRAGWQPDAETLKAGEQSRAQEDDFMSNLFGDDDHVDEAATATRLWLGRRIASRLGEEGPLWPAELALEKAKVGWQRFFAVAWPEWQKLGVLDRLHDIMPRKAQASNPSSDGKDGADARFALQLLLQNLLRGEPRATAYAEALKAVPYQERARADVLRLAKLSRVQYGWSLVKAKKYAEARRVADAAVAEAPHDGQVLFFEARLTWLEHDDPRRAVPRIEHALTQADDVVGRARLLNLRGAVHDALREYDEALKWFHQALKVNDSGQLDHETGELQGDAAMTHAILSNIAEAHWNLKQRREARTFAQQASRRGSATDIVKTILAETEDLG